MYSFFYVERCSLGTCWLFSGYVLSKPSWILFLLTIKIFKDDEKLWANVTFPYKTLVRLLLVRFNVWVTAGTRNLWRHQCKGLIIGCKERHAIAHAVVSVTAKKKAASTRIYYGKFSVHSNNRRWMDISKILGHFGCESCFIFNRQSSIASRLYFQFRDATRWCIRGFIS